MGATPDLCTEIISCRFSFGSLETIDIPSSRQRPTSSVAFGSSDDFGKHSQQPVAIEFISASFSWHDLPKDSRLRQGENGLHEWSAETAGRSNLVLRDIDVSIPEGKLTVVHGEVGSGATLL